MDDRSDVSCKVCRVVRDRHVADAGDRLLGLWYGDDSQRMGYRKLAHWLNVTMLRREMDHVGLSTTGKEAESKYERLRGDDPTIAIEVREMLKAEGIDVERLVSDFVSYGVVRTHIKECLDAEREATTSDWEQDSIAIARNHAEKKVTEAVTSLLNKGKLDSSGNVSTNLSVELECEECQVQIPLERALRREYVCHCDAESKSIVQ